MAGFAIAIAAAVLPFLLGAFGLGRLRILIVGGALAFAWIVAMGATRSTGPSEQPPLWFAVGLVVLLYAIWCGGLWLGLRLRRLRGATPG